MHAVHSALLWISQLCGASTADEISQSHGYRRKNYCDDHKGSKHGRPLSTDKYSRWRKVRTDADHTGRTNLRLIQSQPRISFHFSGSVRKAQLGWRLKSKRNENLVSKEWKTDSPSCFVISPQAVRISRDFLRSSKTWLRSGALLHLPGDIFLIGHGVIYPHIYPQVY